MGFAKTTRARLATIAGCAVSLLGSACTTGTEGSKADAGPIPGTCAQPVTAVDAPGMYTFEAYDLTNNYYWFMKRDEANNRCMILHVVWGAGPAYGLAPSSGYAVQKVILSNSAADCAYTGDSPPQVIKGQTVEAACGSGNFSLVPSPGVICGQDVDATFEFPPTYNWVPATDTYCVDQDLCDGNQPWKAGC